MAPREPRKLPILAGILIGVGLGGFLDGIFLHQILHWHMMLSTVLPPDNVEAIRHNMHWDGVFHLVTWTATFLGVLLLWTVARGGYRLPSLVWFLGVMILGWGLFNLVEGTLNHHILQIHHVRMTPNAVWDLTFLLIGGVGVSCLGMLLMRRGDRRFSLRR